MQLCHVIYVGYGKFYSDFQLCNLAEYWPVPISMFAFSHFDFLALGWTIPRRFEVDLERYSVNMWNIQRNECYLGWFCISCSHDSWEEFSRRAQKSEWLKESRISTVKWRKISGITFNGRFSQCFNIICGCICENSSMLLKWTLQKSTLFFLWSPLPLWYSKWYVYQHLEWELKEQLFVFSS